MIRTFQFTRSLAPMLGFVSICFVMNAAPSAAQTAADTRPTSREQMWFAPTPEDWKKPCLVTWQRTYEDALAVSRETGKPILVCVNMDGEIASEHYAGVRYRQPEIAALYEPYVTVIASVYRHTPRDYDEQGRRILCPRFGSVTCGEHIAVEPGLFDKFFDDKRIAPRHIGVELDKKETFDVYYAFDTDTIFNTLREGIANRPEGSKVKPRSGDRSNVEQMASHDIQDRIALEKAYEHGNRELQRSLLEAAVANSSVDHPDLLRLALNGLDIDLATLARRALAQSATDASVDLIAQALRGPIDAHERDALVAALVRISATSPRARTLAAVHQGLAGKSSTINIDDWKKELDATGKATLDKDSYSIESRLSEYAKQSKTRPDDANARLEFAESTLEFAMNLKTGPKYSKLIFEDARRAAIDAEKLGAKGWRLDAAIAVASFYTGNIDEAYKRAESAVGAMPPDAKNWNAMIVLGLFAESRQKAIIKALREKAEWPAQWLTDVNASYAVLARHPFGNDAQVVAHFDFLRYLGANNQAAQVLEAGLARFPESWSLHERLRGRLLADKGLDALEATYSAMLAEKDAPLDLEWFAGLASIVTAEFHYKSAHIAESKAAYDRAIAHYERGIVKNPDSRENAAHYIAIAMAGRARIAFENNNFELAISELLASFERRPDAAATEDGLGRSPVATARLMIAKFTELKRNDLVQSVDSALQKLDPKLLLPPASEGEGPPQTGSRPAPRQRRR